MAGIVDAPHEGGVGTSHFADQEIGRLHALRGERVENDVRVGRDRAVVEGDHDFMIVERQRLRILHAADAGEFSRSNRQRPAGPERVRIARAELIGAHANACDKTKKQNHYGPHKAPRPR